MGSWYGRGSILGLAAQVEPVQPLVVADAGKPRLHGAHALANWLFADEKLPVVSILPLECSHASKPGAKHDRSGDAHLADGFDALTEQVFPSH